MVRKQNYFMSFRALTVFPPYPCFFFSLLVSSTPLYLSVSVGFEYETCPSLILWEKRTALLQGFELDPSNLGGWSLDKHHILNVKSGMWETSLMI